MLDLVFLLLASQTAPLAAADVHRIHELLLAVHALELNVRVPCLGLLSLLRDVLGDERLGLVFDLLKLFLDFSDLSSWLRLFGIEHSQSLVELFLLIEDFTHLAHVLEVARVAQCHVHIPDIVLILVLEARVWIDEFFAGLLRVDVLHPSVEHTRQVINRLLVRLDIQLHCVVFRLNDVAIDLGFRDVLELFHGEKRAPEEECRD